MVSNPSGRGELAKPGMRRRDDLGLLGQKLEEPGARIEGLHAVQQQHGPARAAPHDLQLHAAHRHAVGGLDGELMRLVSPAGRRRHVRCVAHTVRRRCAQLREARPGLRPRPHQGALPLGTPPRAEPLEPRTGSVGRGRGRGGTATGASGTPDAPVAVPPRPLPLPTLPVLESKAAAGACPRATVPGGGGPGGKAPWRGSGRSPGLPFTQAMDRSLRGLRFFHVLGHQHGVRHHARLIADLRLDPRRRSPCGRAGTAWRSRVPGRSAGCHS